MKKIVLIVVLTCCFSCKEEPKESVSAYEVNTTIEEEKVENILKLETKEPKKAYVCAENGLNVRDENDFVIGKLSNAVQVEILGYTDDEIEIYDNGESIKGRKAIIEYYIQTTDYSRNVEAYVFEGYLCTSKDVRIYNSELCQFNSLEDSYDDEPRCSDGILKLKLVLDTVSSNSVLKRETVFSNRDRFKTHEGILKLPIQKDTLVIKEVNDENADDNVQIYQYLGEIEALNSYVVSGQYWESGDVTLYDKTTGREIAVFEDSPQLSPDNKRIIMLSFEGYEGIGILQLGKIEEGKLKDLQYLNFLNWTITDQPDLIWISNNTFLINVVHINAYWQENGSYNENYQRLKITIL